MEMEEKKESYENKILENTKKIRDLMVENVKLGKKSENTFIFGIFDEYFHYTDTMTKADYEAMKTTFNIKNI